MGKLYLRISNYGPDALQSVPVTVYCGGVVIDLTSGSANTIPRTSQGTFNVTLAPGQTHEFPTQIDLDLNAFKYGITCEVVVASDAATDPVPSNDIYNESIELQGQAQPVQADLAVTDIISEKSQWGVYIQCRITNNGPDAVQNVPVPWVFTVTTSGEPPSTPVNDTETVTLQPGQFTTVYAELIFGVDLGFQITFQISLPSSLLDPYPGNNSYTEQFGSFKPPTYADLALTDIFPQKLPQGDVYCRITNRGPDALQNAIIQLITDVTTHPYQGNSYLTPGPANFGTVTLQPGQTAEFDTGVSVDTANNWYEIECYIGLIEGVDPDSSNNIYSEEIGSPP